MDGRTSPSMTQQRRAGAGPVEGKLPFIGEPSSDVAMTTSTVAAAFVFLRQYYRDKYFDETKARIPKPQRAFTWLSMHAARSHMTIKGMLKRRFWRTGVGMVFRLIILDGTDEDFRRLMDWLAWPFSGWCCGKLNEDANNLVNAIVCLCSLLWMI